MSESITRLLQPVRSIPSPEIGLFVAQLDDQNRRLMEDLAGATPEELRWQPRPGTNTIGMLLAHIALVEVRWIASAAVVPPDTMPIGIGPDDDGVPIAEDGAPPAGLAARDLAWYGQLLSKARAHTLAWARQWTAGDLDRKVQRTLRDGTHVTCDVRWILYHVLEHLAGHYGQILLLRHLHRAARTEAAGGRARLAARDEP